MTTDALALPHRRVTYDETRCRMPPRTSRPCSVSPGFPRQGVWLDRAGSNAPSCFFFSSPTSRSMIVCSPALGWRRWHQLEHAAVIARAGDGDDDGSPHRAGGASGATAGARFGRRSGESSRGGDEGGSSSSRFPPLLLLAAAAATASADEERRCVIFEICVTLL